MLLPGTDVESALLLAERIRRAVSDSGVGLPNEETTTITVSIGISKARFGRGAGELKVMGESLIARADVALYAAKSAGRDRVIVESA